MRGLNIDLRGIFVGNLTKENAMIKSLGVIGAVGLAIGMLGSQASAFSTNTAALTAAVPDIYQNVRAVAARGGVAVRGPRGGVAVRGGSVRAGGVGYRGAYGYRGYRGYGVGAAAAGVAAGAAIGAATYPR